MGKITAIVGGIALACAAPAAHAGTRTYIGTVYGTITSGYAFHYRETPYESEQADLAGAPIIITFKSDIQYNYTLPIWGDVVSKFVTNSVYVSIPIASTSLWNLGSSNSEHTNHPFLYSYADYLGNAIAGQFTTGGPLDGIEPDYFDSVLFSFANASSRLGPLTGSGTAYLNLFTPPPVGYLHDQYDVAFKLTYGAVAVSGAPEPASWALMLLGVGVIGAAMRAQRSVPGRKANLRLTYS